MKKKYFKKVSPICATDKHNVLSGMPQLYGVFSHMYHTVFPICASAQCFVQDNAPYPCGSSDNLYYKFTALIGRYTSWLNRTIERIHIAPTPTPVRKCPPVSITAMDPFDTTLDPIYDVDRYSDRARSMVANRKLCPKHDSTILSSGNPLHRNRSLRTVCVVISGVHVLQLWRWIAFWRQLRPSNRRTEESKNREFDETLTNNHRAYNIITTWLYTLFVNVNRNSLF